MKSIGDVDVPGRFSPAIPTWASEALCALAFIALAIVLRILVNLIAPGAAPFALIYPAALAATLVAGWRSGAFALLLLMSLAWVAVFRAGDDGTVTTAEALNLILYGAGAIVVIAVAEGFRRANESNRRERAERLAEQQLLLRELNHRVKNNFQMVTSLLEMQKRRASDEATAEVLGETLRRVKSMADAQVALYHDPTEVTAVDVCTYLRDLCQSLGDSLLLGGDVSLDFEGESAMLSRDRAVALGMVLNELVTNAGKYAFPGGRSGKVKVSFKKAGAGWRLTVSDDGIGMAESNPGRGGLGKRLVDAFARQAGGSISAGKGPGTTVILDIPA